jgi:capsular exopolysaccharide synthesis family protein
VELIDYVRILRRRWKLIVLVVLACVGGAAVATKLTTPKYQASARLIVNGSSTVSAEDEIAGRQLAEERATAFAQIIPIGSAVQAALKQAEAKEGPFNSVGFPTVSATASGTDPFIEITVTDTDPQRAQAVANAYVRVLPKVLTQLDQPPTQANELEMVGPAALPSSPVSPRVIQNLLIGLALGIVLGAGAAFAVESLDRRLKDSDDVIAAVGLTVLGVVPFDMPGEPIPAETHPMSVRAEAYRKVRTNLAFVTESGTPNSIIITSATSSEGKTSLAVNLAIASARAGQRVVLVDADLRRPMVQAVLRMPEHPGLVDVLAGTTDLWDAIQLSEISQFDVLTSGPVPSNPNELIGSAKMLETIQLLENEYEMVIIDTPPVLPVADALSLSVNVDGVVVVTRLGQTTRDRLRRAKEGLMNVHANILGIVPNGANQGEDSAYAYSYSYGSRRKPQKPPPNSPRAPEIEPHPDNLHPAERGVSEFRDASLLPGNGTLGQSAGGPPPRARHARPRSTPPPSDTPPPIGNGHVPSESVEVANAVGETRLIGSSKSTGDILNEQSIEGHESGVRPTGLPADASE